MVERILPRLLPCFHVSFDATTSTCSDDEGGDDNGAAAAAAASSSSSNGLFNGCPDSSTSLFSSSSMYDA